MHSDAHQSGEGVELHGVTWVATLLSGALYAKEGHEPASMTLTRRSFKLPKPQFSNL